MKIFKILYFVSILLVVNFSKRFFFENNSFVSFTNDLLHKYNQGIWKNKKRNLAEGGPSSPSSEEEVRTKDLDEETKKLHVREIPTVEYTIIRRIALSVTDSNSKGDRVSVGNRYIEGLLYREFLLFNYLSKVTVNNIVKRINDRFVEIFPDGADELEVVHNKLILYNREQEIANRILNMLPNLDSDVGLLMLATDFDTIRSEIKKSTSDLRWFNDRLMNHMIFRIRDLLMDIARELEPYNSS